MGGGRLGEDAYALAEQQRWLLRKDQLQELGFGDWEHRRWRKTKALLPLMPGSYRLGVYPETWEQQVQAALWWGGAGAAACGPTAAALQGIGSYPRRGPIHLSVPNSPKLPRHRAFELELHPGRVLGAWDLDDRDGLVVTRIERTLLDIASTLAFEELDALIDECLQKGLTHAGRLRACLKRLKSKGRKGTELYGRLLAARSNTLLRTDSPLEARFLKLLDELGLVLPVPRFWVICGERRYRLDFAYPELKVGIEIDSREFHDGWQLRLADMARQNDLTSRGWRILRFTHADLDRPEQVAQVIRDTLGHAGRRSAA